MYTKLAVIAAAILINCAIVAAFIGWNANVAANATSKAAESRIITLAPITVYPSATELQALQHTHGG